MPSPSGQNLSLRLSSNELDELVNTLDHLLQAVQMSKEASSVLRKVYDEAKILRPEDMIIARRKAVAALREVSQDYSQKAIVRKDPAMRKSARDDASDIAYIADLVEAGEDAHAKSKTADLDTAVRDEIPKEAYRFVGLRSLR